VGDITPESPGGLIPESVGGFAGILTHAPLPQKAAKKQSRLLTLKEIETLKGIPTTRQHIDRLEKAGKFPKRIKIGARVYWYEHEIDEYILRHADAR
jgi:prophage regulatory protein